MVMQIQWATLMINYICRLVDCYAVTSNAQYSVWLTTENISYEKEKEDFNFSKPREKYSQFKALCGLGFNTSTAKFMKLSGFT